MSLVEGFYRARAMKAADQKRQGVEAFMKTEMPALIAGIEQATTPEESERRTGQFYMTALQAGLPPEALDKMIPTLVEPFRRNLEAQAFEAYNKRFVPQTETQVTDVPTRANLEPTSGLLGPGLEGSDLDLPMTVNQTVRPPRKWDEAAALERDALLRRHRPLVGGRGAGGAGGAGGGGGGGLAPLLQARSVIDANDALAAERHADQQLKSQQMTARNNPELDPEARLVAQADSPALGQVFIGRQRLAQNQPKVDAEVGKLGAEARYADAGVPLRQAQTVTQGALQNKYGAEAGYASAGIPLRQEQTRTQRSLQGKYGAEAGYASAGIPLRQAQTRTEGTRQFSLGTQAEANAALAEQRRRSPGTGGADAMTPAALVSRLNKVSEQLSDPLVDDNDKPVLQEELNVLKSEMLRRTQGDPRPGINNPTPAATPGPVQAARPATPAPSAAPAKPAAAGKPLDANTAKQILQEAGGDKNKARQIAQQRGYKF